MTPGVTIYSELANLRCTSFLDGYPHPAFILFAQSRLSVKHWPERPSLAYTNAAFGHLFGYTSEDEFFQAFRYTSQKENFNRWICESYEPTFLFEIYGAESQFILIDATKTLIDEGIWVCTTLPRATTTILHQPDMNADVSRNTTPRSLEAKHEHVTSPPNHPVPHTLPTTTPRSGANTTTNTPLLSEDSIISVSELMDSYNWADSPIGPREHWPQSLETALKLVLDSPIPTSLYWGSDGITMYNEPYCLQVAATKHPLMWGQPISESWPESWSIFEPSWRNAINGIPAFGRDELYFANYLTEAHLPEEHYATWIFIPIRVEDGSVGGIMGIAFDTTEQVVAQRRMSVLRKAITSVITATSLPHFVNLAMEALSEPEYALDLSFAAMYICKTHSTDTGCDISEVELELARTIAIPEGDTSVPNKIKIRLNLSQDPTKPETTETSTCSGCPWPFIRAIQSHETIHISHLQEHVVSGYERRGFGDRPREAVVMPIGRSGEEVLLPLVMLVLGTNPRRAYDASYQGDLDVLRRTLESILHATLSKELEVKRAAQLAELDAAKTAFFNNASHELRTPLTLIGGPLDDCIKQLPASPIRDNLRLSQRNVQRLKRLVDSLMDFSRLVANKLEGQFGPIKLGMFTANLAELFRHSVEKAGLVYNIECDTSESQPASYVDPELWEKIVFNLVGNALKFTQEGSITIGVEHTIDHSIMTVKDTGIGIPSTDLGKIFQRFYRTKTQGRSIEGTGIGLSLTKELVALHGGQLDVKSSNDPEGSHGTTFTITVPLGRKHLIKANVREDDAEMACQQVYKQRHDEASLFIPSPSHAVKEPNSMAMGGGDIGLDPSALLFEKEDVVLLVDDNQDMRTYIDSILSRYCTVLEASNGQEALEKVSNRRPHVILSDVMMPGMDGFTFLEKMKKTPETALIPLILLTAKSGDETQVKGFLSGADDYLTKPFKSIELIIRVHLQMQLGKRRLELETKFNQRTIEVFQVSEMSPVGIFRTDSEGRITYANPKWYTIAQRSMNTSTDNWHDQVSESDRHRVIDWWKRAYMNRSKGSGLVETLDFRWINGSWCQGRCVSIGGGGALGAFTDITTQKKFEEERVETADRIAVEARRRAEEAEERRRGQELLIDVTSHELRQPVSAILNCSSFVHLNLSTLLEQMTASGEPFTPSSKCIQGIKEDLEALDAIYQCGLAQERIANDVLTLSRLQLEVLSIQPAEFDLMKETKRIISLFENEAQMKKIHLGINFDTTIAQLGVNAVSTDRARFAQIITNLTSNAMKFTDTSADKRIIDVNVSVSASPPGPATCQPPPVAPDTPRVTADTDVYVYVSITDSGPGLDPKDLTRLFRRFQQGTHSHNVFGGSGLGLFVSKQLCTLMGGRIEVLSPPGQGATFRFFIKTAACASAASVIPPSLTLGTPESEALGSIHVLLTEDNLINQTILNRQLIKAGCTTALATNGRQAIDLILSTDRDFDVILMDVEMPIMDGLTAVREIRKMEDAGILSRRHRIIALTGNAREGQVQKTREAGMDDVLIKPYRIDDVLAKMKSHRQ